eukprot:TRINITY_DN10506_c1_g1_i2.p1 TRINITY_DN10506_c1_g1~~TRINITY_DN10506_c1_g1_i2.p1  ORF type:complete len:156 (+),score=21.51 TRINITY_DN10506_c1_g1_i2:347-814(+)
MIMSASERKATSNENAALGLAPHSPASSSRRQMGGEFYTPERLQVADGGKTFSPHRWPLGASGGDSDFSRRGSGHGLDAAVATSPSALPKSKTRWAQRPLSPKDHIREVQEARPRSAGRRSSTGGRGSGSLSRRSRRHSEERNSPLAESDQPINS